MAASRSRALPDDGFARQRELMAIQFGMQSSDSEARKLDSGCNSRETPSGVFPGHEGGEEKQEEEEEEGTVEI